MKVFETSVVLATVQLISNAQQVLQDILNDTYRSPSEFHSDYTYGEHPKEFYDSSFRPRDPYVESRFEHGTGKPIRSLHHHDRSRNSEDEIDQHYSHPSSPHLMTHPLPVAPVEQHEQQYEHPKDEHWSSVKHGTEYIHEMPVQHYREHPEKQFSHDYLVMHYPKPGRAPATSVEQEDPHWTNYRYDANLPIFKAPNVDPASSPTVHASPKIHKDIPITHPKKSSAAAEEGYLVAYPSLPGQKVPVFVHEKTHPLNDDEHVLHHADYHGEELYHDNVWEHEVPAGYHHQATDVGHKQHNTPPLMYNHMETPHTQEQHLSKPLYDPDIHYHSFMDFPPDFYKAEFYFPETAWDGHQSGPRGGPHGYQSLKVHSVGPEGFYFYDPHPSSSFRDDLMETQKNNLASYNLFRAQAHGHAVAEPIDGGHGDDAWAHYEHRLARESHHTRDQRAMITPYNSEWQDPYQHYAVEARFDQARHDLPHSTLREHQQPSERIHSSGEMQDPAYWQHSLRLQEEEVNFSWPSWSTVQSVGSGALRFAGGMVGKKPPGEAPAEGGAPAATSWAQSAGELVGGMMGTGGGESGSMSAMAGQMIGGATGMAGGKDGSFGATVGTQAAGMFKKKEEPKQQTGMGPGTTASPGSSTTPIPTQTQAPKKEEDPSLMSQMPGLIGSLSGETRMKGCWKRATYRGFGEIPSVCGDNQSKSGLWCFQNCQKGYTGFSRTCYKDCPAGAAAGWLGTCRRASSIRRGPGTTKPCPGCKKIGLKYYEDCKAGYKASGSYCKADCPAGTRDAGLQGCKKQTYQRQTQKAACKPDQVKQFPMCYPKCSAGQSGLGPICWDDCPKDKSPCMGVLCLDAGEKCSKNFQDLYTKIQGVVRDLVQKKSFGQQVINIGKLVGDNAPLCGAIEGAAGSDPSAAPSTSGGESTPSASTGTAGASPSSL